MSDAYLPGDTRQRIQDLIKGRKITQAEPAEKVGLSNSALSLYLQGNTKNLGDGFIIRIAKYFDVSTGAFTFSITVVVLPVILLTMRKNVGKKTLISVAFVVSGIVIALGSTITGTQLPGLLLMIFGCTIRAIFIVKLNDFAKKYDSITLSVWISVVGAVISFIIWIIIQPSTFAAI